MSAIDEQLKFNDAPIRCVLSTRKRCDNERIVIKTKGIITDLILLSENAAEVYMYRVWHEYVGFT